MLHLKVIWAKLLKMVDYTFRTIPIDKIILDKDNPRIRPTLEMYPDNITLEQISLALGAEQGQEKSGGPTFDRLRMSIFVNRGIIQPILVKKLPNSSDFKCIEGNTRVAIYKHFKDIGKEGNWQTIPALVFGENITTKQIDSIRLQLHLVGTREWTPYAKAKYLHFLYEQNQMSIEQIVDYCGGNKKDIMDDISAYTDMEKHYRVYTNEIKETFDPKRFSGFREAVKPSVKNSIHKAGYTMDDFAKWIHIPSSDQEKAKLYPLNTVRSLPKILADEKAKEIFLSEGARKAILYLAQEEDSPPSKTLKEAKTAELAEAFRLSLLRMDYEERTEIKENEASTNIMKDIADVILDEFV